MRSRRDALRRGLTLCLAALIWLCAALPSAALAAKKKTTATATPDPIPKPTLPKDVLPYDPEHPENLLAEQLYSWSAILIEAETGNVIFEKNADDIRYPASCTKVMTGLLALTLTDEADMDRMVTCSEEAVAVNTQEEDVTSLKLQPGEEINFRELLEATLVYSANDGANVLAEAVGGSISHFVDLMNEAAQVYGCENTHFANPHGLHDDAHYTTPRDLATITRIAMQNEEFRRIVRMQSVQLTKTNFHRARTVNTTNELFSAGTPEKPNKYYYPDIIGVKTGFTSKAQYCFIGAAERDGVSLISVVMYAGNNSRWADTIKLLNYGFSQYTSVTPVELYEQRPITIETSNYSLNDSGLGKLKLRCVATDQESRDTHIIATFDDVEQMAENLREIMLIQYTRDFAAPIDEGEVVGTMTYVTEDGEAVVYNLVAERAIAKRENAPPSLAELAAAADADPNPLPPLNFEIVLLLLPPLLIAIVIFLILRRLFFGRRRHGKTPRVRQRFLR